MKKLLAAYALTLCVLLLSTLVVVGPASADGQQSCLLSVYESGGSLWMDIGYPGNLLAGQAENTIELQAYVNCTNEGGETGPCHGILTILVYTQVDGQYVQRLTTCQEFVVACGTVWGLETAVSGVPSYYAGPVMVVGTVQAGACDAPGAVLGTVGTEFYYSSY